MEIPEGSGRSASPVPVFVLHIFYCHSSAFSTQDLCPLPQVGGGNYAKVVTPPLARRYDWPTGPTWSESIAVLG